MIFAHKCNNSRGKSRNSAAWSMAGWEDAPAIRNRGNIVIIAGTAIVTVTVTVTVTRIGDRVPRIATIMIAGRNRARRAPSTNPKPKVNRTGRDPAITTALGHPTQARGSRAPARASPAETIVRIARKRISRPSVPRAVPTGATIPRSHAPTVIVPKAILARVVTRPSRVAKAPSSKDPRIR